jgi:hypothetical protein
MATGARTQRVVRHRAGVLRCKEIREAQQMTIATIEIREQDGDIQAVVRGLAAHDRARAVEGLEQAIAFLRSHDPEQRPDVVLT